MVLARAERAEHGGHECQPGAAECQRGVTTQDRHRPVPVRCRYGEALYPMPRLHSSAPRRARTPNLFYSPGMNARVAPRLLMESRLRRAVAQKEFTLFYRPTVDIITRQIRGLEALVRCPDPELGMVFAHGVRAAARGVPHDRRGGPLGDQTGRGRRRPVVWRRDGCCRAAVNVSEVQLRQPNF